MDTKLFERIKADLVEIFPPETDEPRFRYVRRTWIFPNHFDITIDFARQLAKKYGADEEICMLGALLHDAGLAYKREQADPVGHETLSVEYAETYLPTYGYDPLAISKVLQCILATEPEHAPQTLEEKVVRTADALSHIFSVHYLAKAVFSPTWDKAVLFVERKIESDFQKICFEDEQARAHPAYEYYTSVIKQYRSGEIIKL